MDSLVILLQNINIFFLRNGLDCIKKKFSENTGFLQREFEYLTRRKGMATIPIRREDNSEIIPYNFAKEDYYVFLGTEKISDHPNNTMLTHWHSDVELMVLLSGHMKCNVGGQVIDLKSGTGVFINSQQIHYCFSANSSDCEFIYLLWHPVLLCATGGLEKAYIDPILKNGEVSYIYLTTEVKWKNDILSATYEALKNIQSPAAPLMLQSILYRIWAILYENIRDNLHKQPVVSSQMSTLKAMLSFIQKNYGSKIYLEDIANAGNVSISYCNSIFKKYLKEAPIKYLLNYRLLKSCELLRGTECSITQITYECGFSNASYYIDAFRKSFNCTPLEFRNKNKA